MRISSVAPIAAALGLALALSTVPACQGDPNDPLTWAKQLKNLRTQKEALDHLANMDVDKARPLFLDRQRPAPRGAGRFFLRASVVFLRASVVH